jgi:hypothetical protein
MGFLIRASSQSVIHSFIQPASLSYMIKLLRIIILSIWNIILFKIILFVTPLLPIPVTAPSKTCVYGRSLSGLWVRIPPGAWMFVCCECCVLSTRGFCVGLISRPEESYRLWCVCCVWSINLQNEETIARVGPQRHEKKQNIFTLCMLTKDATTKFRTAALYVPVWPCCMQQLLMSCKLCFWLLLLSRQFESSLTAYNCACTRGKYIDYTWAMILNSRSKLPTFGRNRDQTRKTFKPSFLSLNLNNFVIFTAGNCG